MLAMGFLMTDSDHSVFVKVFPGGPRIYVFVYVDDLLVMSSSEKGINKFKTDLSTHFDLTDKVLVERYLGMDVIRLGNFETNATLGESGEPGIYLSQRDYVDKILLHLECMNVTQFRHR